MLCSIGRWVSKPMQAGMPPLRAAVQGGAAQANGCHVCRVVSGSRNAPAIDGIVSMLLSGSLSTSASGLTALACCDMPSSTTAASTNTRGECFSLPGVLRSKLREALVPVDGGSPGSAAAAQAAADGSGWSCRRRTAGAWWRGAPSAVVHSSASSGRHGSYHPHLCSLPKQPCLQLEPW